MVLDLGRKYIMSRYMNTVDTNNVIRASAEEEDALDTVSKMVGTELDNQCKKEEGWFGDLIEAMEKNSGEKHFK